MKKKRTVCGLLLALMMMTSGCWDNIEPKERSFVIGVGLSAAGNNQVQLFLQLPTPSGLKPSGGGSGGASSGAASSGSGGGSGQSFVLTSTGPDFLTAVYMAQRQLDRDLFFGQVQAIVISKGLAERGLTPVLDQLERYPFIDPATYIVIAEPSVGQVIATTTPDGKVAGRAIAALFHGNKWRSFAPNTRIWQALRASAENHGNLALPLVTLNQGEERLAGVALLSRNRLVGTLGPAHSLGLSMLTGSTADATLNVPFRGKQVTVVSLLVSSHWRYTWPAGQALPRFEANLNVTGAVLSSAPSGQAWTPSDLTALNAATAQTVLALAQDTWRQLAEAGSDALDLGSRLSYGDPARWEKITDWSQSLQQLPVTFKVRAAITASGNRT